MATGQLASVLRCIHHLAGAQFAADGTDRQLLQRFVAHRDEDAFAALVRRHGPMVLGVCWRVLRQMQDAEDVFQATFLVLARKAASIAWRDGVGNWLYEAAYRLALEVRGRNARRHARERQVIPMRASETPAEPGGEELANVVEEELHRLPERYRAPLLLCVFEGKTRDEAAGQLGCSLRTVKHRLERGRSLLRQRLARRGVTLAVALLLHEAGRVALSAELIRSTARAASPFAAGRLCSTTVSPRAATLAEGVLTVMLAGKVKIVTAVVLTLTILAAGAGLAVFRTPAVNRAEPAHESPPKTANEPRAEKRQRVDAYGDPLPDGALARLGTVRLRQGGWIHSLSLSADGKLLASGGADNAVRLWQLPEGKEIRCLQGMYLGFGTAAALAPDGKTVATGGADLIYLWDTATGAQKKRLRFSVHRLAFSPDGKILTAGGLQGPICLWDAATGKELCRLSGHKGQVNSLAFSADGKRLLSGGWDKRVRLWDVVAGTEIRSFDVTTGVQGRSPWGDAVLSVDLSADGQRAVAGCQDHFARLWDTTTGKEIQRLKTAEEGHWVNSVSLSPDAKVLATLDTNGPLRLWDVKTGKELKQLSGAYTFGLVRFSPDGKYLLGGGYDKTIRIWDVATGREAQAFGGHQGAVAALVYSPDGKWLATGGEDRTIRLWDTRTHQEIHRWPTLSDGGVGALAFSPDGKILASGEGLTTIRLWDIASGKEIRRLTGHRNGVICLVFAPDGKTLASGTGGGEIKLWDPNTGQARITIDRNESYWKFSLAFSPNGKVLASGSGHGPGNQNTGAIRLWDVASGKELPALQDRDVFVTSLAFSPDGQTLAVGLKDYWIRLWNLTTGKPFRQWQAEGNFRGSPDFALAFSPDGKTLATETQVLLGDKYFSIGPVVRTWEVATGKKRLEFRGHRGQIKTFAFAPDGRSLSTGSEDTTVLIWDLTGDSRAGVLTDRELTALWTDLESDDAAKAFRAMSRLSRTPAQSVPFIKERLKPIRAPNAARIGRHLRDLESEQFAVREKATEALHQLGESAEPDLRRAIADKPTAELRKRVELLLESVAVGRLRPLRCIEMLEHLATPEAVEELRRLAGGLPEAWLTRQAKASLARLSQ
jgi:RNA polymerase sigma factor (sigma-70 family)